jgi:hypothetical protein
MGKREVLVGTIGGHSIGSLSLCRTAGTPLRSGTGNSTSRHGRRALGISDSFSLRIQPIDPQATKEGVESGGDEVMAGSWRRGYLIEESLLRPEFHCLPFSVFRHEQTRETKATKGILGWIVRAFLMMG